MVGFDLDQWLDSVMTDKSLADEDVLKLIELGRTINNMRRVVFTPKGQGGWPKDIRKRQRRTIVF